MLFTSSVASAELNVAAVAADVQGASSDVVLMLLTLLILLMPLLRLLWDFMDVALVCSSVSVVVCAWVLGCGNSVKGNERIILLGVKFTEIGDIGFRQARVTWLRRGRVL